MAAKKKAAKKAAPKKVARKKDPAAIAEALAKSEAARLAKVDAAAAKAADLAATKQAKVDRAAAEKKNKAEIEAEWQAEAESQKEIQAALHADKALHTRLLSDTDAKALVKHGAKHQAIKSMAGDEGAGILVLPDGRQGFVLGEVQASAGGVQERYQTDVIYVAVRVVYDPRK